MACLPSHPALLHELAKAYQVNSALLLSWISFCLCLWSKRGARVFSRSSNMAATLAAPCLPAPAAAQQPCFTKWALETEEMLLPTAALFCKFHLHLPLHFHCMCLLRPVPLVTGEPLNPSSQFFCRPAPTMHCVGRALRFSEHWVWQGASGPRASEWALQRR